MIKIFMSVRNRLALTKKVIETLEKNTKSKYQLYVYDNSTDYLIDEHTEYFGQLFKEGRIAQYTFTSKQSTFNIFSKAVTLTMFGMQHLLDPKQNDYDFILIMDNDMVVYPGWDKKVKKAIKEARQKKLTDQVKVITQFPGGVINPDRSLPQPERQRIGGAPFRSLGGCESVIGYCGGSAFWCLQPDFFRDVGFIPLHVLQGKENADDQIYWEVLRQKTNDAPYSAALKTELAVHWGTDFGSVCNVLRNEGDKDRYSKIQFGDSEIRYDEMNQEQFYEMVMSSPEAKRW